MKNKRCFRAFCLVLTLITIFTSLSVCVGAEEYIFNEDFANQPISISDCDSESTSVLSENVKVGSRILDLLLGKKEKGEGENIALIPGGGVFGVKIKQQYVTITESSGIPALKSGDIILSVNGQSVSSAAEVKQIVRNSDGKSLTIRALHQGQEVGVEILPSLSDGEYKIGLSLRDGAAGLGTITFIDPESGVFGGLGHGICDSESGEVIQMGSGEVCGVILGGIHKGESGKPGELCGVLTEDDIGDLTINSDCGVFGVLSSPSAYSSEKIPIGTRNEVSEGRATIISTLKNGKTAEYSIEIYDIDRNSDGSKSFRIRVTDETLKAITGGIVRGMSGSPIIQNGKLIGAVTHVMVADPTEGYGIFIENMLNAAGVSSYQRAA